MVPVPGDKLLTVQKGPNRSPVEGRSTKVVKRTKERKQSKSLGVDTAIEAVGASPESEDTQDSKEKKSQAVVIDGKTYTCATCKTGHRVGICKHARERPMTATHPPGRPAAGAPKKIVCDCPKQCSCKKRGCKCARKCSCTQLMYMLVYVPAPGEEDDDEEKGTWKLGQRVTTDLKGNVLTQEQVEERHRQKEAQKIQAPESGRTSLSQSNLTESNTHTFSRSDARPEAVGGCCRHKDNVTPRRIAAEASPHTGKVSDSSADGCNCGSGCVCAFCPQHPNNTTSINMAREQAVHFANQPYFDNDQSIVPMMSNLQQGASCMGGLPQFAISRFAEMPSHYDLQRAFPKPGYIITYPVWSTRTDNAGLPIAPFPTKSEFEPNPVMIPDTAISDLQPPFPAAQISTNHREPSPFDYSQDEFGIGNAFVASAGTGDHGWDARLMSSIAWPIETPVQAPVGGSFVSASDYWGQPTSHSEFSPFTSTPDNSGFDFSNRLNVPETSPFYDLTISTNATALEPSFTPTTQKSCCEPVYAGGAFPVNQPTPENHTHAVEDDTPHAAANSQSPMTRI